MAIKFEKKDERTFVGFITETKAVRAIKEHGHWRIDHASAVAGAWMPWEPIDENHYRSSNDALVAIRGWVNDGMR